MLLLPERTEPRTMGPQGYDREALMPRILSLIESGYTLRQIAKIQGMPSPSLVVMWTADDPWSARYAHAREQGWHAIAEQTIEIADDGSNDTYTDDEGRQRTDHDVVNRSRLRVDTRKWLLSKMLPKVYGDRIDMSMSGTLAIVTAFVDASRHVTGTTVHVPVIPHATPPVVTYQHDQA